RRRPPPEGALRAGGHPDWPGTACHRCGIRHTRCKLLNRLSWQPGRSERLAILETWRGAVNAGLSSPKTPALRHDVGSMSLAPTPASAPSLDALRALVAEDWANVNRMIVRRLGSDVALVNQVAHHIIHNGGKRLRPLAVLLAARACGCRGEGHIAAAAIIEFIHTATLLHDDVVDSSGLRRGRETANALFGNQASVLV